MAIAARLERFPTRDRRSKPRHKLQLGTNIRATGDNVSIHDISTTGMLIETSVKLAPFDALHVDLPEKGATEALVMWSSGRFYGCEFTEPLSQAAISAAFLRSSPGESLVPPIEAPAARADSANSTAVTTDEDEEAEDKLPLPVRVSAIAASALLLWIATIWAIIALVRLVERSL
jgi:hypothetical protein